MRPILVLVFLATAAVVAAEPRAVAVTATAIVLRDPVTFEVARAAIRPESYPILDALAATLTADTRITLVEIQVHTDARGSASWNRKVSQARAEAIYRYLVDRGIDGRRLRATGFGESRPLDKRPGARAQAKNRRVAFAILQRIT